MSEPAYVVMPVQGGGTQDGEQISLALQEALKQKTAKTPGEHNVGDGQQPNGYSHDEQGEGGKTQRGPLKEIMAHQDSLYKYISWEDPVRTLGSLSVGLSILFGAHYLPLTQWALKVGATAFGVVSVTELASRQFGPNTFLSRLRPQKYKKIPEATLNATLHDIHDFAQYATVQVQRTVFAEDLTSTTVAFVGLTLLYWLIKFMSPFALAVVGLISLYIAPLVTSTRGREVAHDARVRAGELANAASENGRALAQDGKAKAADLSSKARDTVTGTTQSTKDTAANLSNRASDTASDLSGTAAEQSRRLQQMGHSAINQTSNATSSTLADAGQYINGSRSSGYDGHNYGTGSVAGTQANQLPHPSHSRATGPDGVLDSANLAPLRHQS